MSALSKTSLFDELVNYAMDTVSKSSGNVFNEQHRFLIETKIRKRMMDLNLTEPHEYQAYIKQNRAVEDDYLTSELTTHHTFFFREFRHFEFLQTQIPNLIKNARESGKKKIKILCLACSRGQEVYSVAMFFHYHLNQMNANDVDFEIEGTDVDKASVKIAENGVYRFTDIKSIPMKYLGDHWQRGLNDIDQYVRVKDSLRTKVKFRYGNLLNLKNELKDSYDIIFCRNVFIYFNESQIKLIGKDILNHLAPEGFFFTGVSESLTSLQLPIDSFGPSIYGHNKKKAVDNPTITDIKKIEKQIEVVHQPQFVELPKPLKILCVDDSKIILSLLKKIFNAHPDFEVVGTAENGEQAHHFLKDNKVDLMTLDLHMPIMDGQTYMKTHYNANHPPVVIVSSVSREDAFVAMESLRLGASDYIEKPSLDDFMVKEDEICTKLKVAALENIMGKVTHITPSIDKEFHAHEIAQPDKTFYAIYGQYSSQKKIKHILSELKRDTVRPCIYLFYEANYNVLDEIVKDLQSSYPLFKIEKLSENSVVEQDRIYICDFKSTYETVMNKNKFLKNSMAVIGQHSKRGFL